MPRLRRLLPTLLALRPRRRLPVRRAARARLAQPGDLLRGLHEPACSPPRGRRRSPSCRRSASTRCASSSPGPTSRPAPRSATQPGVRRDQPRELRLGPVRRGDRRSPAAALAGAADGHLAGAAVGDLEQARRPTSRGPTTSDFQEFMTAVGRHYGSEVSLFSIWNEANHPRLPAAAVELERHAGLAAHLPRALPGRLRGPAGGGHRQPEGALRRDGADGLRLGQALRRERSRALLHDVAPLRVPARSALPERAATGKRAPAGRCR